jgi:hypothetical protein
MAENTRTVTGMAALRSAKSVKWAASPTPPAANSATGNSGDTALPTTPEAVNDAVGFRNGAFSGANAAAAADDADKKSASRWQFAIPSAKVWGDTLVRSFSPGGGGAIKGFKRPTKGANNGFAIKAPGTIRK